MEQIKKDLADLKKFNEDITLNLQVLNKGSEALTNRADEVKPLIDQLTANLKKADKAYSELDTRFDELEEGYNELEERLEKVEKGKNVTPKDAKGDKLKLGRFKIKDTTYEFKALKIRVSLKDQGSVFGLTQDVCKNTEVCAAILKEQPQLVEAL